MRFDGDLGNLFSTWHDAVKLKSGRRLFEQFRKCVSQFNSHKTMSHGYFIGPRGRRQMWKWRDDKQAICHGWMKGKIFVKDLRESKKIVLHLCERCWTDDLLGNYGEKANKFHWKLILIFGHTWGGGHFIWSTFRVNGPTDFLFLLSWIDIPYPHLNVWKSKQLHKIKERARTINLNEDWERMWDKTLIESIEWYVLWNYGKENRLVSPLVPHSNVLVMERLNRGK